MTSKTILLLANISYSVWENLVLDEVEKAQNELQLYKVSKGGAICEMSVVGIRRPKHSPADLSNISQATGVHIISATGFYCQHFLPDWARILSVQGMADFMMEELLKGVGGSGVRCGVMYIGCSYPLKETERRALEAAAITHKHTGVAMAIHPGRNPESPFEIVDILASHGVPANAICMSHMERTFTGSDQDLKKMFTLCERGCYVNHSLFGKECSHYQVMSDLDFPSDAEKIQRVKGLIAGGCVGRVLVSHDVVCRHEWVCYGGNGYGHMLEHIFPKFVDRGVQQSMVDTITKQNPRNWLTGSV